MDEAATYLRGLIDRHHAAMLAGDVDETRRLRGEAHLLAAKLNGGNFGILTEDGAGTILERETAAPAGTVPLWGQTGEFIIALSDIDIRIELHGLFGIGATHTYWPGFAAHAMDRERPFISGTGYRSFLGVQAPVMPELTPDRFVTHILSRHIEADLKGRLVRIDP